MLPENESPAPYTLGDVHPTALTQSDLDAMAQAGDYAALAAALADGRYTAPTLPDRATPAMAGDAPQTPRVAAQVPTATPMESDPSLPTRLQCAPGAQHTADDCSSLCAGYNPLWRRAQNLAHRGATEFPQWLADINAECRQYLDVLTADDAFPWVAIDGERIVARENQQYAAACKALRYNPPARARFSEFRYNQPCSLAAAARACMAAGLPVFERISGADGSSADDLVIFDERASPLSAYSAPLLDAERDDLHDPARTFPLHQIAVFALGASPVRMARAMAESANARMAPPLQQDSRDRVEQLDRDLTADQDAVYRAIAYLCDTMPQWDRECEAREAQRTVEGRASRSLARSLSTVKGPEFTWDIAQRRYETLGPDQIRAAFAFVAQAEGFAPPMLGEPRVSKFVAPEVSDALKLWMAIGGSDVRPGVR